MLRQQDEALSLCSLPVCGPSCGHSIAWPFLVKTNIWDSGDPQCSRPVDISHRVEYVCGVVKRLDGLERSAEIGMCLSTSFVLWTWPGGRFPIRDETSTNNKRNSRFDQQRGFDGYWNS